MRYDFKCEEHGIFEIEQRMSETTKTYSCPECGAECPKHIGVAMFNCAKAAGDYKIKSVDLGKK